MLNANDLGAIYPVSLDLKSAKVLPILEGNFFIMKSDVIIPLSFMNLSNDAGSIEFAENSS